MYRTPLSLPSFLSSVFLSCLYLLSSLEAQSASWWCWWWQGAVWGNVEGRTPPVLPLVLPAAPSPLFNSSPFRSQRLCCWPGLAPVWATILDFDSQFTLDPQVSRVFVCQPHSRSLMPTISPRWQVATEDSTVLVTTSISPRLELAENHQPGSLSSPRLPQRPDRPPERVQQPPSPVLSPHASFFVSFQFYGVLGSIPESHPAGGDLAL